LLKELHRRGSAQFLPDPVTYFLSAAKFGRQREAGALPPPPQPPQELLPFLVDDEEEEKKKKYLGGRPWGSSSAVPQQTIFNLLNYLESITNHSVSSLNKHFKK
jgi:hypothetical protein